MDARFLWYDIITLNNSNIIQTASWQNQPNDMSQISLGICPVCRVFAVHMKKAWVFSYPLSKQWRLWSDWVDAWVIWVFSLGTQSFCWFCREVAHIMYSTFVHLLYEPPHDKINNVAVRPAKTHISLGIRPVWSESSLCPQWVAKDPSFLHVDSEDSDQTGRMPKLIWVFAGRTATLLVLSWGGSYIKKV